MIYNEKYLLYIFTFRWIRNLCMQSVKICNQSLIFMKLGQHIETYVDSLRCWNGILTKIWTWLIWIPNLLIFVIFIFSKAFENEHTYIKSWQNEIVFDEQTELLHEKPRFGMRTAVTKTSVQSLI